MEQLYYNRDVVLCQGVLVRELIVEVALESVCEELREFVRLVRAGEDIVITEHNAPVARLIATTRPRKLRTAIGHVVMSADFDGALEDFREYV